MAKWIWPVMIEMPDDYDFDGASDAAKRELQLLDALMQKGLSGGAFRALTHEDAPRWVRRSISVGPVMLPGRAYGWDVDGSYADFAAEVRQRLGED